MTYLDCNEGTCVHSAHQKESLAELRAVLTQIAAADRNLNGQGLIVNPLFRGEAPQAGPNVPDSGLRALGWLTERGVAP